MEDIKNIGEDAEVNKTHDDDDRIHWLGADGGLVLLFIVLVITEFCSLYYKIDILSGYVFPGLLFVAVCIITIRYLITLRGFMRSQNQAIRSRKAQDMARPQPDGNARTNSKSSEEEDDLE
jgi:hypothetical protein